MLHQFVLLFLLFSGGMICEGFHLNEMIDQMTEEDLNESGLYKLTESEKEYFQVWLDYKATHYYAKLKKEITKEKRTCLKTEPFFGNQGTPNTPVDESQMIYDLALCSPFQHDAPYLKEWLDFYIKVGVQHFYLYNHLSGDDYREVLQEYIDNGIVELIEMPTTFGDYMDAQPRCYNDALNRAYGKARWLIIADSDLFFIPLMYDNLIDFLRHFETFGGLTVNYYDYGSNGIETLEPGEKMTEKLITRSPHLNHHVKSIVKPHRVAYIYNPHFAVYKDGFYAVDEDFLRVDGPFNERFPARKIRINHYWCRTREFLTKVSVLRHLRFYAMIEGRPLPMVVSPGEMQGYENLDKSTSIEEDRTILNYF